MVAEHHDYAPLTENQKGFASPAGYNRLIWDEVEDGGVDDGKDHPETPPPLFELKGT